LSKEAISTGHFLALVMQLIAMRQVRLKGGFVCDALKTSASLVCTMTD
jgi:hypothetical protein